ncbi:hypothetical protein ACYOEI_34400 [Singulisphaera rosea]
MTVALVLSRLALGMSVVALGLTLIAQRLGKSHGLMKRKAVTTLAAVGLGIALLGFGLGLVAGCDQL